jgi:hypothetical protein
MNSMQDELVLANSEMKAIRRAKLRALLEAEYAMYVYLIHSVPRLSFPQYF